MLMAWLVCDFEIKASLILVRAGLKAVSSVRVGRQRIARGGGEGVGVVGEKKTLLTLKGKK